MKDLYLYIIQRIHPGSIVVAVVFDLLWSFFEGGSAATVIGVFLLPVLIVAVFISSFGAVTLIQRLGSGDEWTTAAAKGVALGVLAAVPFSAVSMIGAAGLGFMRLTYGIDEEVILLGKLTRSWREIEQSLRSLAPKDVRGRSLDELINYLYSQRLLSSELKDQLHHLRKQRNRNMHDMTSNELTLLVDEVQAMENTLRVEILQS
jgi:hypothetical protein